MSIIFGSARVDEKGGYIGGAAGDQTGKEVSTQPYYMHRLGWYCLRPKKISVANAIAKSVKNACDNNNIGYDQGNRFGIVEGVKKCGSTKAINYKTEADCSTTIRAACIEAGFDPGNFTTYNEATILAATGQFEAKFEVASEKQLYNGDVLVSKKKGHTVAVVSGRPRKETSTTKTATTVKKPTTTKKETKVVAEPVIGDKIKVDGLVYANATGNGSCLDAKNRTLYVIEILDKKKYQHYIGVAQRKGGTRFGWISLSAIK